MRTTEKIRRSHFILFVEKIIVWYVDEGVSFSVFLHHCAVNLWQVAFVFLIAFAHMRKRCESTHIGDVLKGILRVTDCKLCTGNAYHTVVYGVGYPEIFSEDWKKICPAKTAYFDKVICGNFKCIVLLNICHRCEHRQKAAWNNGKSCLFLFCSERKLRQGEKFFNVF